MRSLPMSRNTNSAEQYAIDVRKELAIPIATSIDFDYVLDCLNIRYRKVRLKAGVLGASEVIGLKKLIVVLLLLFFLYFLPKLRR